MDRERHSGQSRGLRVRGWNPLVTGRGRADRGAAARVPRGRVRLAILTIGLVTLVMGVADGSEAAQGRPLPKFSAVRAVVLRELVRPPERMPGDIVARSEVQPVFDQLRLMGWFVLDEKAIVKRVPADTDFVLQRLRTRRGRSFMRKVARYPQAYDRLYRLASLPHGRQTVVRLIDSKGGDELIAYLTESRGGENLGKMLQAAPGGAKFNRPTGKIFTADALVKRLKESYTAEVHRRRGQLRQGSRRTDSMTTGVTGAETKSP